LKYNHPMHVHAEKPNNSHHNLLWIALFSPMIMFFILFNSRLGYFLFSLGLFVVIFFTSYLYWNFLLFPNKTGKQRIAQQINNVFNLIQHPYLINVANGRLDTDYFLLQEKPRHVILIIDSSSFVALQGKGRKIELLSNGTHNIHQGLKLMHIFDLNLKNFQYCKGDMGSLSNKNENRSISPTFKLFYRFDDRRDDFFLNLSNVLRQEGISGETETILEKSIGQLIHTVWHHHHTNLKIDQLIEKTNISNGYDNQWIVANTNQSIQLQIKKDQIAACLLDSIQSKVLKIYFQTENHYKFCGKTESSNQ